MPEALFINFFIIGIKPLGKNSISSTSINPRISSRSMLIPIIPICSQMRFMTNAPMIGPPMVPIPPLIVMIMGIKELCMLNISGLMK